MKDDQPFFIRYANIELNSSEGLAALIELIVECFKDSLPGAGARVFGMISDFASFSGRWIDKTPPILDLLARGVAPGTHRKLQYEHISFVELFDSFCKDADAAYQNIKPYLQATSWISLGPEEGADILLRTDPSKYMQGLLGASLNQILEDRRFEKDWHKRIRLCWVCEKFFFAGDIRKKLCSPECVAEYNSIYVRRKRRGNKLYSQREY